MEKHRHSIRLKNFDYSREALYFITLCTHHHRPLFGNIYHDEMHLNPLGRIIDTCWQQIPTHYPQTILHEYVIMPNHLHGIIEITPAPDDIPHRTTLGDVIRGFKIGVTKAYGSPIWKRNYYDHIIRKTDAHENIVAYILNNPIEWEHDRFHRMARSPRRR